MPITDQQAAVLRAMLSGDTQEYKRLRSRLDPRADQRPYAVLVSNAFIEAADRRFGESATPDDIIEFVADVRSRSEGIQGELDPIVAERVLLAGLGKGDVSGLDSWAVRSSQILLLAAMMADASPGDDELDTFMALARAHADQQLARLG
jgi:hypothetical protein